MFPTTEHKEKIKALLKQKVSKVSSASSYQEAEKKRRAANTFVYNTFVRVSLFFYIFNAKK